MAGLPYTPAIHDLIAGQANTSKHLQLLRGPGFVDRRKEGLYVYYRLADPCAFALCDIMCGQLRRGAARTRSARLSPR